MFYQRDKVVLNRGGEFRFVFVWRLCDEYGGALVNMIRNPQSMLQAQQVARKIKIAVLVPCYNEEVTIAGVVAGFKQALPEAVIYVYDNNSTDHTVEVARAAGAAVHVERRQGKGQVVRRMFADIEADCYILVDGDGTYDASVAAAMVEKLVDEHLDFVNVSRVSVASDAYRPGHRFGNVALTELVRFFFGREINDMLSGYKALSRRFVKSFPAMSSGFETETELAVHALEMRMPMGELSAPYRERPSGSASKLRTYHDGMRILLLITRLIKDERPLRFFGFLGVLLTLCGLGFGIPVVVEFFKTGLVARLPTAVLSVSLVLLGFLCIFSGIILDMVTKARHELKRLQYLQLSRVGSSN